MPSPGGSTKQAVDARKKCWNSSNGASSLPLSSLVFPPFVLDKERRLWFNNSCTTLSAEKHAVDNRNSQTCYEAPLPFTPRTKTHRTRDNCEAHILVSPFLKSRTDCKLSSLSTSCVEQSDFWWCVCPPQPQILKSTHFPAHRICYMTKFCT